jgi:hypothetical protein
MVLDGGRGGYAPVLLALFTQVPRSSEAVEELSVAHFFGPRSSFKIPILRF